MKSSLVAMSSAAVFAVYSAGYVRTRSAAEHLAERVERRVVAVPVPVVEAVPAPVVIEKPKPIEKAKAVPAPQAMLTEAPPVAEAVVAEAMVAPEPEVKVEVALPPPPPPAPKWKDGTYTGWGTSRHGDIQSQVVIEGGRIVSATIAQCQTRYSCSVIDKLPPQVAARQSADVDTVSGATQSADAFYYGVVEALGKAK